MNIWMKNGAIVANTDGAVVDCSTCPCLNPPEPTPVPGGTVVMTTSEEYLSLIGYSVVTVGTTESYTEAGTTTYGIFHTFEAVAGADPIRNLGSCTGYSEPTLIEGSSFGNVAMTFSEAYAYVKAISKNPVVTSEAQFRTLIASGKSFMTTEQGKKGFSAISAGSKEPIVCETYTTYTYPPGSTVPERIDVNIPCTNTPQDWLSYAKSVYLQDAWSHTCDGEDCVPHCQCRTVYKEGGSLSSGHTFTAPVNDAEHTYAPGTVSISGKSVDITGVSFKYLFSDGYKGEFGTSEDLTTYWQTKATYPKSYDGYAWSNWDESTCTAGAAFTFEELVPNHTILRGDERASNVVFIYDDQLLSSLQTAIEYKYLGAAGLMSNPLRFALDGIAYGAIDFTGTDPETGSWSTVTVTPQLTLDGNHLQSDPCEIPTGYTYSNAYVYRDFKLKATGMLCSMLVESAYVVASLNLSTIYNPCEPNWYALYPDCECTNCGDETPIAVNAGISLSTDKGFIWSKKVRDDGGTFESDLIPAPRYCKDCPAGCGCHPEGDLDPCHKVDSPTSGPTRVNLCQYISNPLIISCADSDAAAQVVNTTLNALPAELR